MRKLSAIFCSVLFLAFVATSIQATGQTTYNLTSEKSMIVKGSSSAHDWDMKVNKWDLSGDFYFSGNELTDIKNLTVEVSVASLESGKKVMDKKTYEALEEERNPAIQFKLNSIKNLRAMNGRYAATVVGNLTIAGRSEMTEIFVVLNKKGDGTIQFNGNKTLDMTEWNIAPPTAMLGAMKVGSSVTISFEGTLAPTVN